MTSAVRASYNLLSRRLVCSLLPWGLPRLIWVIELVLLLLTVYNNIPAPWATHRVIWRYTIGYLELLATGMTGKPSPRGTTPPIHTTGSAHSSICRAMAHKRAYTQRSLWRFLARTTSPTRRTFYYYYYY